MAAGGEDLGDAGGFQPGGGHAQCGAQACPAGADNNHVIAVIDNFVRHARYPLPSR